MNTTFPTDKKYLYMGELIIENLPEGLIIRLSRHYLNKSKRIFIHRLMDMILMILEYGMFVKATNVRSTNIPVFSIFENHICHQTSLIIFTFCLIQEKQNYF